MSLKGLATWRVTVAATAVLVASSFLPQSPTRQRLAPAATRTVHLVRLRALLPSLREAALHERGTVEGSGLGGGGVGVSEGEVLVIDYACPISRAMLQSLALEGATYRFVVVEQASPRTQGWGALMDCSDRNGILGPVHRALLAEPTWADGTFGPDDLEGRLEFLFVSEEVRQLIRDCLLEVTNGVPARVLEWQRMTRRLGIGGTPVILGQGGMRVGYRLPAAHPLRAALPDTLEGTS